MTCPSGKVAIGFQDGTWCNVWNSILCCNLEVY
jgi:hypothetical protein